MNIMENTFVNFSVTISVFSSICFFFSFTIKIHRFQQNFQSNYIPRIWELKRGDNFLFFFQILHLCITDIIHSIISLFLSHFLQYILLQKFRKSSIATAAPSRMGQRKSYPNGPLLVLVTVPIFNHLVQC